MDVSGFFTSAVFSNDEYKNKKNSQTPQKLNSLDGDNSGLPDPSEMNKEIKELLQKYEGDNKKKELSTGNEVSKPKKLPTNQEIYDKYESFKQHILSQFVQYDKFMEQIILRKEGDDTSLNKQDSNNNNNNSSSSSDKTGALNNKNEATKSTTPGNKNNTSNTNNSNNNNNSNEETSVKRLPPLNLVDTYVIFTSINTSFQSTKYSEFLKIKTTGASNTKKWYRKYFRYFFVVDGILEFLDPESKLPIEVLKDFEDLMIQKATTPKPSDNEGDAGQSDKSVSPDSKEKSPTPGVQPSNISNNNANRFSHEMFLSGTNLTGYSIFMSNVKRNDFIDFIKCLHTKIISKYGPTSVIPELSDIALDTLYEKLIGSGRPEPLMAVSYTHLTLPTN
mgnify:FL=1